VDLEAAEAMKRAIFLALTLLAIIGLFLVDPASLIPDAHPPAGLRRADPPKESRDEEKALWLILLWKILS
jgi:hypothetical protein